MKSTDVIWQLIWQFLSLSLIAVGGANAVLPEMHRYVVEINHWMSGVEFASLFAIAQAAPGPNVIIVSLVGWKVAGFSGAMAATAAMCGPSSILAYCVEKLSDRFRHSPVRRTIQAGVAPVTIGIVLASGYLLARGANHNGIAWAATAITVVVVLKTRLNPLWLLACGALLGMTGFITPFAG